MAEPEKYVRTLHLKEGWLSLDFANTAEWHASDHPDEGLNSYPDLVSWAQHVGILTDREAGRLLQKAGRHPADASAVLDRAISLREAIYRIFSAAAVGRLPEAADLAVLNAALSEALTHLRIVRMEEDFAWDWTGDEDALDQMLWPVVRSAADLLTSEELHRVGQCADDRGCGWLFLDTSRNHSRQWCAMKDCGNRAKARRHYERERELRKERVS
ncbi:MAG: CGNR zinc finger domain-containing protein [Anaerolineae bacterium]